MMKFTIVYDNEAILDGLKSDWGFSCLVQSDDTMILFDTGTRKKILLNNFKRLGINPLNIKSVVISHDHFDHDGGLEGLIEINPEIPIYRVGDYQEPVTIIPGIMTTGVIGNGTIKEQALLCFSSKGIVVLTGCSHPGLENILIEAKKQGKIYAVIGGFHGFDNFSILEDIPLIMPCHCTRYKKRIEKLYPNNSVKCGAGKVLTI
ncbi:MAG: MBL fold metallo-hydrolase [Promethearchaeota archaeon]